MPCGGTTTGCRRSRKPSSKTKSSRWRKRPRVEPSASLSSRTWRRRWKRSRWCSRSRTIDKNQLMDIGDHQSDQQLSSSAYANLSNRERQMGMASRWMILSLILELLIQSSAWFCRNYLKQGAIMEFESIFWMRMLLYFTPTFSPRSSRMMTSEFSPKLRAQMKLKKPLKKFLGRFLVFLFNNVLPLLSLLWKKHTFLSLLFSSEFSLLIDQSSYLGFSLSELTEESSPASTEISLGLQLKRQRSSMMYLFLRQLTQVSLTSMLQDCSMMEVVISGAM